MGIQFRTESGHWRKTRGEYGLDIAYGESYGRGGELQSSLSFSHNDEFAFSVVGTTVYQMIVQIIDNATNEHRRAIRDYIDDLIGGKIEDYKNDPR